jgi:hypothetical protein
MDFVADGVEPSGYITGVNYIKQRNHRGPWLRIEDRGENEL